MATKAKAKRTAKAKKTKAEKIEAAELDAAELRKARPAGAASALGDDGDEFDMAATGYEDAADAITAFANIVRDAGPRDILDIVDKGRLFPGSDSRMKHGRPGLAWWTIADFLTGWVLIQGGYFSRGQTMRLDGAIAGFDQAWCGMFEALLDRFPDSAATLVPIQSGFDELFSLCMLNDWHKKNADNKANEERCSVKAIELAARLADALKIAARTEIAAGGHSVKGAAALTQAEADGNGASVSAASAHGAAAAAPVEPRMPTGGREAEDLQRLYILHRAVDATGGIATAAARVILDKEILDDWAGVPVCMFDRDDGRRLGKYYGDEKQNKSLWKWIHDASTGTQVPETLKMMARRFADAGRAMSWPKAFCDAVGIQVDD